jgi:hypothetical protein
MRTTFRPAQRAPRSRRPLPERRKKRSSSAAAALQCALDCAATRGDLDVLLLADEGGMVVCNSATPLDLRMLAAVTPIVARGRVRASIKRRGHEKELSVRTIELQGERFHVAALGGEFGARERELANGVAAAQRILA